MALQAPTPMFIVEDDDHFRETFMDVMSLKGVPVSGARSGGEALRELKRSRPSVIIMDMQLPDMEGVDLCRRVKSLEGYANTPIIFVSACAQYEGPRGRAECLRAGAAEFLSKPVGVERLWSEIERVLAGSRPS